MFSGDPEPSFLLGGRHLDGRELWNLSRISARALLADLDVAEGRSRDRVGGGELGDVLGGLRACRQKGRGLPQAPHLLAEGT